MSKLNVEFEYQNEKVFNDAIHGAVEFHPMCVKIIDTPQFQRLRFISQCGPVYQVFPAACHNRFEHCLGVSHLAGELTRSLGFRQPELGISDVDILCVEIAGLCHDLGHGPFSHLFEKLVNHSQSSVNWSHEKSSTAMLDYLLEQNDLMKYWKGYGLTENDLTFVKEMISGPSGFGIPWPYQGREEQKGFLYEIVANKRSGVDVDKWDYILRDCHNLGMKVTFDHRRLIKFCRVIDVPGEGRQVCYRDKEENNLSDLFHARKTLHRSAYRHRVVSILENMIIDFLRLADKYLTFDGKDGKQLSLIESAWDMKAFSMVNDDVLMQVYRHPSQMEGISEAKNIVHNILTRKLYPYIGDMLNNCLMTPEKLKCLILERMPLEYKDTNNIIVDYLKLNYGMGCHNPLLKVRFYSKNDPNLALPLKEPVANHHHRVEEEYLRVFSRSYDKKFVAAVSLAFSQVRQQ